MGSIGKSLSLSLVLILTVSSITSFFSMAPVKGQDWYSEITSPSVQFSIENDSVLYSLGNFSIGFVAQGCYSDNMILISGLYSVSCQASWLSSPVQVYRWDEGSPNPRSNFFFYSVDLTHAPQGPQQIEVTVTAGGKNYGGGIYVGDFSLTSSYILNFTISAPPSSAITPTTPGHAIPTWNVQTVDTNGAGVGNCHIVVDSDNVPHLAYSGLIIGSSISLVKYASWNGFGWSIQTVDVGSVCSLVLDANNNPHILYGGLAGLTYATWTGTNWSIQTVDKNSSGSGALALDSSGNPHVAYIADNTVKYASWTGSSWSIQTVDTYSEISSQLSLALDQNNTPYLLYDFTISVPDISSGSNGNYAYWHLDNVRLAVYRNSSWSIQNVTSRADGFGNMVLDSKGYPHTIYELDYPEFTGFQNSTLLYASWDGTAWNTKPVVSGAHLAFTGFLSLDSHDNPHIVYITSDSKLLYASWTGKAWDIQNVNSTTPAGGPLYWCNLAIDSKGNPHLTYNGPFEEPVYYYQEGRVNVMYATASNLAQMPTATSAALAILSDRLPAIITVAVIAVIIVSLLLYRRHQKTA